MKTIIEELYTIFPPMKTVSPETLQEIRSEYLPLCDRVEAAFGFEFVDRFTLLRAEMDRLDDLTAFRRGFCLGARLMLELFTPA